MKKLLMLLMFLVSINVNLFAESKQQQIDYRMREILHMINLKEVLCNKVWMFGWICHISYVAPI